MKHVPASHPVLRRQRARVDLVAAEAIAEARIHARTRAALALELETPGRIVSASEVADMSARIEDLAQRVVLMPDGPFTPQQRRSIAIIATELLRRVK